MIRHFDQVLAKVAGAPSKRVAVAGAAKTPVLEALAAAVRRELVEPVLLGPAPRIRELAERLDFDIAPFSLIDTPDDEAALSVRAVAEVKEGRADLLMKGSVSTERLLKAVLDRAHGLRSGRVLSHVAVAELPSYPRLMLHTDGGINLHQDLATRKDILANAVELARCLENDHPHVACMALVEKENPKLPETLDMSELMRWAGGGPLGNLIIEGPLAIDVALSREAAQLKGIPSRVAGRADIFLGPNISAVNFVVKSLILLAGAKVAGLVLGAAAPIVLLSRSDSAEIKLLSLALGTLHDEQEIARRKHRPYFG
ncbi:MAG: phosphate butyryltransferase [Candidatus Latescibacteria bacterium]|nr:phosphate butyryltransferase [Candidatus Latescibacterota bacterium]